MSKEEQIKILSDKIEELNKEIVAYKKIVDILIMEMRNNGEFTIEKLIDILLRALFYDILRK